MYVHRTDTLICTACGTRTPGEKQRRSGSSLPALILFFAALYTFFFVAPLIGVVLLGLALLVERLMYKPPVTICHSCKGTMLVPVTSPVGRELAAKYSARDTSAEAGDAAEPGPPGGEAADIPASIGLTRKQWAFAIGGTVLLMIALAALL